MKGIVFYAGVAVGSILVALFVENLWLHGIVLAMATLCWIVARDRPGGFTNILCAVPLMLAAFTLLVVGTVDLLSGMHMSAIASLACAILSGIVAVSQLPLSVEFVRSLRTSKFVNT